MSNNIENEVNEEIYNENQIQVLEGLEAVRKRPGMYIGSTSSKGLHHLVYEIVDNAVDEALAGHCTEIIVEILPGNAIRVSDNGRGIPTGIQPKLGISALTVVFTVLHAGGKFDNSGYKVSGGLHGVGAAVVNALSKYLEVEVCVKGELISQRFELGKPVTDLTVSGTCDPHRTGSAVTFLPDSDIFEETVFEYDILRTRLREQTFLNAGLKIILRDLRDPAEPREDDLCYEGGIKSFVEFIQTRRGFTGLHDVISIGDSRGTSMAEVALQYNESYNDLIISFANTINTTDGGTHELGFKTALTRTINDYARKFGLLKEADKNFSGEDVREGLIAIISVKLQDAQFEGQTKAKLGNSDIRSLVETTVYSKLTEYFEENPKVARAVIEKSLNASRAREAAKKARELTRRKSVLETAQLPGKLSDCSDRNPENTEIYIVEGDSAAGTAKGGRDRTFQAILPLWGKMLNVEKARIDKVYGNEKLLPVVTALGSGVGEDFDVEKLRYGKIIIMADADVDGSHIRTLLLTFFFRYMRPLIEGGHLYIAQPPLFKVFRGKNHRYAFSPDERDEYIKELGGETGAKVEVQRYKGLGEMNSEQLWETTMNPETRIILKVEMDDATTADEVFTVLMGDKVAPRREFIETNAKYAKNIDV